MTEVVTMPALGEKPSLERIGFVLESLKEDMEEVKKTLDAQNEMYEKLEKSHGELKNEVQNFKIRGDTTVRIFKWIISFLVAVITFKLGDVKSLLGFLPGK